MGTNDKPMSEWTPEEWGRAAVALPGWPHRTPGGCGRFESGIEYIPSDAEDWANGGAGWPVPNPDDATGANAGCFEALLGEEGWRVQKRPGYDGAFWTASPPPQDRWSEPTWFREQSVGRARIAAAIALGRWPGGAA